MKQMLINAKHQEELRVAIIDDCKLFDLNIETESNEQKKSNIYKGIVSRIEPSLDAAFIEYGEQKNGFLPLREAKKEVRIDNKQQQSEILKEKQEIMVQVEKEERGNKGASLTTFISLPGSYIVLMPNSTKSSGISRRIDSESKRLEIKEIISKLEIPENMSVIIRTAGLNKSISTINNELQYLIKQWESIQSKYAKNKAPSIIFQEDNIIFRTIRDYLRLNIENIIIDEKDVFLKVKKYVDNIKPGFSKKIKFYNNSLPIFTKYKIESQIETAYKKVVHLKSGGSIVIDSTEALTAIDINSAKATKGQDIEATALHTNLEAAEEISKQLRIRDLGGLIVIDFIDMGYVSNQKKIEDKLNYHLASDRAKIHTGKISRFGLLEMSRQRIGKALEGSVNKICETCKGRGTLRTSDSIALLIIRTIEENCLESKNKFTSIELKASIELSIILLNKKRVEIKAIENKYNIDIYVIPTANMGSSEHKTSYYNGNHLLFEKHDTDNVYRKNNREDNFNKPYISQKASKTETKKKKTSVFSRIVSLISSIFQKLYQKIYCKKSSKKTPAVLKIKHKNNQESITDNKSNEIFNRERKRQTVRNKKTKQEEINKNNKVINIKPNLTQNVQQANKGIFNSAENYSSSNTKSPKTQSSELNEKKYNAKNAVDKDAEKNISRENQKTSNSQPVEAKEKDKNKSRQAKPKLIEKDTEKTKKTAAKKEDIELKENQKPSELKTKEEKTDTKTKAKAKPKAKAKAKPETKVEKEVKAKPETKVEKEVKAKVEKEVKAKPETKVEKEAKAKVEKEAKAKVEKEAKAKPETKVEKEAKAKPEAKVEEEVKAKPETKVEEEVKAKPEAKVEEEVKAKPEAKVEEEVKAKPEAKVEEEVKAKPEAKVEEEAKAIETINEQIEESADSNKTYTLSENHQQSTSALDLEIIQNNNVDRDNKAKDPNRGDQKRTRRSPRHLRAAGQRKKKNTKT